MPGHAVLAGTVALGAGTSHQGDSRDEITPPSLLCVQPSVRPSRATGSRPRSSPWRSGGTCVGLSFRDVEELLAERGIEVDHVTVYRWVHRFAPEFAEAARARRHIVGDRWHVDETYLKEGGSWRYLFRAIDQFGQVIDVYLSPRRDGAAARRFFDRAMGRTRISPAEVTTDRCRVYPLQVGTPGRLPGADPHRQGPEMGQRPVRRGGHRVGGRLGLGGTGTSTCSGTSRSWCSTGTAGEDWLLMHVLHTKYGWSIEQIPGIQGDLEDGQALRRAGGGRVASRRPRERDRERAKPVSQGSVGPGQGCRTGGRLTSASFGSMAFEPVRR